MITCIITFHFLPLPNDVHDAVIIGWRNILICQILRYYVHERETPGYYRKLEKKIYELMMNVLKKMTKGMAVALVVVLSLSASNVSANTKHSLGLWAEGGASAFLDNMEQTKYALGGGGAAGFGYELQHKRFLMDIGVEFQYASTFATMNPLQEGPISMIDDDPMNTLELRRYNGYFDFLKRQDISNIGTVNIPVMFGGKFRHVYFLVGAKVGLNMMYSSKVKAETNHVGEYLAFMDPFQNMPNHYFCTDEIESQPNSVAFFGQLDVKASLELGYAFGDPKKVVNYRVGVFADYGVLNVNTGAKNNSFVTLPTGSDLQFQQVMTAIQQSSNHIYSTGLAQGKNVNSLFAGVKFTVWFRMPSKTDCRCEF